MIRDHVSAAVMTFALLLCRSAHSDDYPQRVSSQAQSLTKGMPKSSIPLLSRIAGNSASARQALVASLCGATCQPTVSTLSDGTSHITTADWVIDVRGDGTSAEGTAPGVLARAHGGGVPQSARMTASALEGAGRAFVASKLSTVIVLGPAEQLVPITAVYRVEGGQDAKTLVMAPDSVVANRIQFGRTIDGTPVVGGGSTVTITFANDGSVESFRYDWASYATTARAQSSIAAADILSRVQRMIGLVAGSSGAASMATSASYPVALSTTAQLRALECGYFDPGFTNRSASAPVQSGCVYHVVHTIAGSTPALTTFGGYAGTVPAGTQIEADASWPEAGVFLGNAPAVDATPLTSPTH